MQKLNEPSREKQHNFLLSLIIASAFIIIYSFSAQYGGDGTNDDFAIGIALSGRIPEANMSLFVNAAFCNIVALLNQGIPDINWFWLIERFVAFASLSSLLFVGLEKHNEYPALLVLAACACMLLLAGCTYQGNFSYVASFATVAGGVVLLIGIKTPYSANYKKPLTAIGVSLMVIGFSIRIESFLLFMPFFSLQLSGRFYLILRVTAFLFTNISRLSLSLPAALHSFLTTKSYGTATPSSATGNNTTMLAR